MKLFTISSLRAFASFTLLAWVALAGSAFTQGPARSGQGDEFHVTTRPSKPVRVQRHGSSALLNCLGTEDQETRRLQAWVDRTMRQIDDADRSARQHYDSDMSTWRGRNPDIRKSLKKKLDHDLETNRRWRADTQRLRDCYQEYISESCWGNLRGSYWESRCQQYLEGKADKTDGGSSPGNVPGPPDPRSDPLGFPSAHGSPAPPKHNDLNTMRPATRKPPLRFPTLRPPTYFIYPVERINVINADGRLKPPDKALKEQKIIPGTCDVIANGSFTTAMAGREGLFALASVMRDTRLDNSGIPKTWGRGAVAVLKDGSVVIGRQRKIGSGIPPARVGGEIRRAIEEEFGEANNPVLDFMGGGALLIENGKRLSREELSQDLFTNQRFDNGGFGLAAEQFRKSDHTLVAIREGQAFLIIARGIDGTTMWRDMERAGISSVVMFDGGGGFYWNDGKSLIQGENVLGFCIKVRSYDRLR